MFSDISNVNAFAVSGERKDNLLIMKYSEH